MGKCRYSAGRVHNDDMPLRYQWFMAYCILLGTFPTISLPTPQTETHLGPGFFNRNLKMWTTRWVCWAWMVFGKVDATGPATFDLWGRWVEFPNLKHLLPRPHGLCFNHVVHIWFEYFWYFWHIHIFWKGKHWKCGEKLLFRCLSVPSLATT